MSCYWTVHFSLHPAFQICEHKPQQDRRCCVSKAQCQHFFLCTCIQQTPSNLPNRLHVSFDVAVLLSVFSAYSYQHCWSDPWAACAEGVSADSLRLWTGVSQSSKHWGEERSSKETGDTIKLKEKPNFCLYVHVPVVQTEVLTGASSPISLHCGGIICSTKHQCCVRIPSQFINNLIFNRNNSN